VIRILEYDDVDPSGALELNLLSLNYALTRERVALIRQLDLRPFPFFAIYAVENGVVAGQVGVYRLPTMTIDGPEDVGGISAMCTHPAYSGRGIATLLLDEAHRRMREAGLRFATLGTARHRGAYTLYRRHEYQDLFSPLTVFASRTAFTAANAKMRAERAGQRHLHLADELYQRNATGRLGFSRRQEDFLVTVAATGEINQDNLWLFWEEDNPTGYAIARMVDSVLIVDTLVLSAGASEAAAIASLMKVLPASFLQIRIDLPSSPDNLRQAGFPAGRRAWSTLMIKPLLPGVTVDEARVLFGIGKELFMVSLLDVT